MVKVNEIQQLSQKELDNLDINMEAFFDLRLLVVKTLGAPLHMISSFSRNKIQVIASIKIVNPVVYIR